MFVTNSGTAIPIANELEILGNHVAASGVPVATTGATNVVTINVQASSAQASSSATNLGLASFDSADFTVDGNGFVALAGAGATETLTGNSGGAVGPTANNINIVGTGSITVVGNPGTSTLTSQLTGLTNHNVLLGAGTATITNLAPSATSGVPLISQGASSDPAFGTAVVAGGGTGLTSTTAYAPVCGGTTTTGALQSASTGIATSGFVLTSTGSGSLPTFQTVSASGAITTITGNSGGAQSPSSGNFNILGTGSITVAGSANTETVQLTGITNHALQVGAGTATLTQLGAGTTGQILQTNTTADPTWSTATYPSTTTINQLLYSSSANTVAGLATINNGVLITSATGVPSLLADGTTGQVLTATTGSPPTWSSIASGVSSVTGTANQILASPTTGAVVLSLIGPYTPATYTAHGVLVGEGTSSIAAVGPTATAGQILQSAGSLADPAFSTATYPSTTTVNQILYSSSANTVAGLATANRAVMTTGATGAPALTALATDGQLIIGSTAGAPAAATLSAGTGISISNASNSITISVNGSTVGETITGNSGGALSPTAGNWNTLGTGSITISGSGSTLTSQLTGLTNHNVLLGAGTATITNLAPSATSGVPLISQGASSDPAFGTAVVAGGGTGLTSTTAYAPVCGGTTTTGALQSASTGIATSGFVLTSTGSGSLPTWQANPANLFQVKRQVFASTGTYTPTSGMVYCDIEAVGGGGGGGGCAQAGSLKSSAAGGGGGGGYARGIFSSATIGASQSVTIGAAGTAGTAGNNSGGTGGTTSVGALISATGGTGGSGAAAGVASSAGAGGAGTGGDFQTNGMSGMPGSVFYSAAAQSNNQGSGGSSFFGGGALGDAAASGGGRVGASYGGGGAGAGDLNSANQAGGAGAKGVVIVTEYII